MIEALDPKLIQIFHINDAEDLPRDQLEDRHRLLPGLGILPLREMVSAFRRIGYDKVASVEIFRPEYWERDPFELARDAHAATEASSGNRLKNGQDQNRNHRRRLHRWRSCRRSGARRARSDYSGARCDSGVR